MTSMTASRTVPELVFSGAMHYVDQIVAAGHRSILVNARSENISSLDARAWARRTVGRELGDFTLYIRHPSHVEEYVFVDGRGTSAVHPVWNYLDRGIDSLVPLLRGEWTGHLATDEIGNTWPVGPAKGQEGYKLFLLNLPRSQSLASRMLSKFFTDALASDLIVPKVYYDSVKGLVGGLNFGAPGVVYNPSYPARHGEVLTGQGRRVQAKDLEELRQAKLALAVIGYTPEEVAAAGVDELTTINILSARWAAENWREDVMPVGPKALGAGAPTGTA